MHADQLLTVISSHITSLSDITKADFLCRSEQNHPSICYGSLPFRVVLALPIPCVISVALPPSSIPKRVFLTSLAITRQSSLSRMRIKFPDFVHAVKPEPHWAIPQGQSAHDTFWDYVSLQPETLHNVMWAMSDRGIPRSYRTMEGFGIHTFRLINAEGKATFVRFHWKPLAGKASLVWDEAQKLTGRDPGLPPPRVVGSD